MMATFIKFKILILASAVLIASLMLNFAVARMNIGLMSMMATNDYDLLNVRSVAISMTLLGFVFSSITAVFWQRRQITPALVCAAFTVAVFIYECHGVIGSFSDIQVKYEENSDTAKLEKMRIELAEKKLKILEVGKVDSTNAESRLVELKNQVLAKEAKAAKCKLWAFECKNKALAGSEQLAAEIDGIHNQMNHQNEYVSAISEAQSEIESTDNSENKKTFAVFQTISRFFYGVIDYAKAIQAKLLVYMSILIVLLAQSSLAIALLLLPRKQATEDDLNGNPQFKKRFIEIVDNVKSHIKTDNHRDSRERKEPVIVAELKRTGTDDKTIVTHGYSETANVVNFPVRNVTSNAVTASNGNVSRQRGIATNAEKTAVTLRCLYCNAEFVTVNLRQKYCCPAHKVAFHRTKKPDILPELKESSIS